MKNFVIVICTGLFFIPACFCMEPEEQEDWCSDSRWMLEIRDFRYSDRPSVVDLEYSNYENSELLSHNLLTGFVPAANRKENFMPGIIKQRFHNHVPSLTFLVAKNVPGDIKLPEGLAAYAAWIQKVIAYNHLVCSYETPDKEHFPDTYDCPDEVFYRLNKGKIDSLDAFFGADYFHSNHPLTRKSLIKHGASFDADSWKDLTSEAKI